MGKVGRPKLQESSLKRQLSICLTQEERNMVSHMADEVGQTVSQVIAFLIRQGHASSSYLALKEEMSPEELENLDSQRERVKFKTQLRAENAQNRNLSRRMGLDRGLTNVMVVAAPPEAELPGIYCEYFNNVWIIPYCMLHKLQVSPLLEYSCYESVMDYFAGNEVTALQLANFIEEHKEYTLTSEGEKSVLRRLAQVYNSLDGLPDDICFPEFPEKDPADLPYLKDLTVKGEYPFLAYSDRQKVLQDALTLALQAISQVENQIRFEEAALSAQDVIPNANATEQSVKRGRGRPRKTEEAKEVTRRRKYLQVRAERMLNKVYKLALYNNEPVKLPPEITHQAVVHENELNYAFINTVQELKAYLKNLTDCRTSPKRKVKPQVSLSEITAAHLSAVAAADEDIAKGLAKGVAENAAENTAKGAADTAKDVAELEALDKELESTALAKDNSQAAAENSKVKDSSLAESSLTSKKPSSTNEPHSAAQPMHVEDLASDLSSQNTDQEQLEGKVMGTDSDQRVHASSFAPAEERETDDSVQDSCINGTKLTETTANNADAAKATLINADAAKKATVETAKFSTSETSDNEIQAKEFIGLMEQHLQAFRSEIEDNKQQKHKADKPLLKDVSKD